MEHKTEIHTIEEIIEQKESDMLSVNPEYQRGSVWTKDQKKLFIDSIFRDYPVPVFFFHEKEETSKDFSGKKNTSTKYEIIDGQQRINAIYEYHQGGYKLFDPKNPKGAKFTYFSQNINCSWANKEFEKLDENLQNKFLKRKIYITFITEKKDSDNEARDLFIRLQAGSALNEQEKRDAWPGEFTDFIYRLGGKTAHIGYQGHDFFPKVMRISHTSGRGKTRKICAQMYQLYDTFAEKRDFFPIKKESLDELYRQNIDFDKQSDKAKEFTDCLDILLNIFGDGKCPKMANHEVFHLLLLVISFLKDNYVEEKWKNGLPSAYEEFYKNTSRAKTIKDDEERANNEYWMRYVQYTSKSADNPDTIARRHIFFSKKILEYMREKGSLISKDSKRTFTGPERDHIYLRDYKKCLMCEMDVVWQEVEIHHVKPHAEGGRTILENGVLVHKNCHPKASEDVKNAAVLFEEHKKSKVAEAKKITRKDKSSVHLPEGTLARAFYNRQEHNAKISSKGKWILPDGSEEKSPSGAAGVVTGGKSINGFKFWQVKRPDDKNWLPLQALREETV